MPGIASVNEWVNCIDAGAQCVALRRNPHPDEQDLNVPRCLFDGSGIDAFQGLSFEQRVDFIGQVLKGTAPGRRNWAERIRYGRDQGLFEESIGSVTDIRSGPAGLVVDLKPYDSEETLTFDATGVVCGTGFVKSALSLAPSAAAWRRPIRCRWSASGWCSRRTVVCPRWTARTRVWP